MKKPKKENIKNNFEESIRRVEEIAVQLEDGSLPLQERLAKFEEGMALLKECEDEIKEIDLTIQRVIEKSKGYELKDTGIKDN